MDDLSTIDRSIMEAIHGSFASEIDPVTCCRPIDPIYMSLSGKISIIEKKTADLIKVLSVVEKRFSRIKETCLPEHLKTDFKTLKRLYQYKSAIFKPGSQIESYYKQLDREGSADLKTAAAKDLLTYERLTKNLDSTIRSLGCIDKLHNRDSCINARNLCPFIPALLIITLLAFATIFNNATHEI